MPSHFSQNIGIGSGLERRRAEIEAVEKLGAQYYKVYGEVEVVGTGESSVGVTFPVFFTKKPAFHGGGELAPGGALTWGQVPTCSVVVLAWDTGTREDGSFVYVGAYLGIVTTGTTSQVMNAHWSVEGIGIRNPTE